MTPVFCCGFECGVTAAHWTLAASASFSTSTVRTGARSLRCNPSAASTGNATLTTLVGTNVFVFRCYMYFASLPTADATLLTVTVGIQTPGIFFKQSDGKLYTCLNVAADSATGISITTGQWYRIDLLIDVSNNPWTQKLSVDGVEVTSSDARTADTGTVMKLGMSSSKTFDIFFDDFIMSNTVADYPISAGQVLHFVPTADGSHTATTTTIVKGTIAAPTAGGNVAGSSDVFNWVNGVPLLGGATDNTRLVNQQTAGATLYAECIFGAAPSVTYPIVAPRAVEVITADREATTATCDFTAKINDNGTEATIIARGVVAGVITDRYATKQFATPPTGGAWNMKATGAGSFKNLRARWGYASDATPDLYWRGIMVEAEFGYLPPPNLNINQSVNRANTY